MLTHQYLHINCLTVVKVKMGVYGDSCQTALTSTPPVPVIIIVTAVFVIILVVIVLFVIIEYSYHIISPCCSAGDGARAQFRLEVIAGAELKPRCQFCQTQTQQRHMCGQNIF